MIFLKILLALIPAFASGTSLQSTSLQSTSLHVISYNIKGLPSFALGSDYQDSRYPLIGKLLGVSKAATRPRIVLLQEAFDAQTSELLKAANYPHVAEGPGPNSFLGVSAGLYILSQFPIVERSSAAFGKENCLSWDCFANKGVQLARIAVPGMPQTLEVYNTHLQAGREDSAARQAQVKVLLEFFKKNHRAGAPVIFGGDFNFRPGLKQVSYLDFISSMGFFHAGEYCLKQGCAKVGDEGWHGVWERAVDHQFYSKEGPVVLQPTLLERRYRSPVENLRLSDHPTHEVHYELRWPDPVRAPAALKSGS